MGTVNEEINGVEIRPLRVIADERGKVMHMLRANAPHFTNFGEVYFSIVNPGVIKGWKLHKKMTQNFAVPMGDMEIVMYDSRGGSSTKGHIQKVVIGESNYALLTIPPGVVYGFKALSKAPVLLTNCADLPHDPEESMVIDLKSSEIPYAWT